MKQPALILLLAALAASVCSAEDWQALIKQLEGKPRNATNNKLLAIACNNYAIELQNDSDWDQAEKLMQRAVTLDATGGYQSNLAFIYLNHACALYQQRAPRTNAGSVHREAKLLAQRALASNSDLADAHILIGDIEYENQNLKAAEQAWGHAKRIKPNARGLDDRLKRLHRESTVETTFKKNSDAFFDIRYQQDIDPRTASGLRLALETARKVVGNDFAHRPKHRLVLLVYSSEAFSQLKLGPHWAGGVYDGKIRLPLDKNATEQQLTFAVATLFHEYTHAIVHDLAKGNCPVWLNEGLAEVQESKIASSASWMLKAACENDSLIPLRILDDGFTSFSTGAVNLAYEQAHSLASYLLETKGNRRVKALLERLGKDTPLDVALREACNLSAVQLEVNWKAWLSSQFDGEPR